MRLTNPKLGKVFAEAPFGGLAALDIYCGYLGRSGVILEEGAA
jgi:hypothetical protein